MTGPVLQLEGLSKSFGGLRVTRNVDLSVEANEVHALIGPNGAGKSTLIAQIFGEIRPDSGKVILNGDEITTLAPFQRARRDLARSFQISSILPECTVLENVMLGCYAAELPQLHLWKRAVDDIGLRKRALRTLETVRLSQHADAQAGTLSYGGRRHLELAMILAVDPKVILLDEPMAGVGPEESRELTEVLRSLKARCAILLVEHDMDVVLSLADRISVLVDGAIVASGAPAEVRADERVMRAYFGEADA